jgi:quinohemoprotein amine dehydrogenase alpha subunit-like protein
MIRIPLLLFILFVSDSVCSGQSQEMQKTFQYKPPQFLYEEKCSRCHTLERVFAEPKTDEEWRVCVSRMTQKSPAWLSEQEGAIIIRELAEGRQDMLVQPPQKKKYADAQLLFVDRCTKCHTLNRILNKDKTREEWKETILRMRENAPDLFLDEDIPVLTEYLAERGTILREDVAARIMVEKCLICHEEGRILLELKSVQDWEKCVADMRNLARQRFKKDWFTSDEFKLIVNLLVKTQGLKESESSVPENINKK